MILIRSKTMRSAIKVAVPFVILPLLTIAGAVAFDQKKHIIISMAVAFFALLLFAAGFEKRSTGTRRMVIVAVMTALCFAGRFIPFLKPIMALTIISALYLGGEAGFLVGALAAVLSNFYFGQGSKPFLLFYGALSGMLYSFIMDIWTVLWYAEDFSWKLYQSALITAIPYTLSYMVSNVLFLLILSKPIGDKLARIKIKYGI